jgi:hypothetical protein
MRTSTAYFAGLGTVVVAVAAGLGGGYLAANIVNPHEPGVSKLERRMSATPMPAPAAPSQPVRIAGTTAAATNPVATSPIAAPPQTEPQQTAASQAPALQASALQTPPKSEPQTTASNAAAPVEKTANITPRTVQPAPAKPAEQASEKLIVEKTAAPQEAFARARDADIKRAAVEKRRAERRQRWEERRRFRQPREQELEAVEEKVREITEPRHAFAVERVRTESPRIRLFDLD